eukprot:jgi/Picsp_1/2190/NSC_05654-R1_---NA---
MSKDVDFTSNFADEPVVDAHDLPFPVFGLDKNDLLLIPCPPLNNLPERKPEACNFEETIRKNWESKIPHGVWRGATTGLDPLTTDTWREQARPELVLLCNNPSDICDARISGYVQATPDVIQETKNDLQHLPRHSSLSVSLF